MEAKYTVYSDNCRLGKSAIRFASLAQPMRFRWRREKEGGSRSEPEYSPHSALILVTADDDVTAFVRNIQPTKVCFCGLPAWLVWDLQSLKSLESEITFSASS